MLGSGTVSGLGTALTLNGGNFFGVFADNGAPASLVVSGAVSLSGTNTYTGGTTISAGSLLIGNGATSGSVVGNIVDNAALLYNRSDAVTFAGTISGTGSVTQFGTGTLILTGANTYTGGTGVSAGTLRLGTGGSLAAASQLSLGSGATFDLNGHIQTVGALSSSSASSSVTLGAGALTVSGGFSSTFAGVISGTGSISVAATGSGSLLLTGANTYSGGTTIASGSLILGNGGTTGSIVGNVVDNGALTILRSNTYTLAGNISGSGQLNENTGGGRLVLTGANTYTGTTVIAAGATIQVGSGGTAGSLGTGSVINNGSLIFNRTDNVTVANAISGAGGLSISSGAVTLTGTVNTTAGTSISSGATLQVGSGGTTGSLFNNIVNNGSLVLNRSNSVSLAGLISGIGTLRVAGGSVSLFADETYTGLTTIDPGASLLIPTGTATGSIAGNIVDNGVFNLNHGVATTANVTYNGVISGTGNVIFAGNNIITAAQAYTGVTSQNSATLYLNGLGNISASSSVELSGYRQAGFDISGVNGGGTSIKSLASCGNDRGVTCSSGDTTSLPGSTVTLGANTLTLTNASGNFLGAITGAGGVTLSAGTETLSGVNTYAGGTTVAAGTLALSGSGSIATSSAVAVAGTLDISGVTAGTTITTLSGAGTVALGNQTLTISNGSTTFSGVIRDAGLVAGTGSSLILAGGSLTLSGANIYTGATTVSAGTLNVTGSIAGAVTVASGATLAGTGTVGATTIAAGGLLSPAGAGAVGTLNVNGNLSLASTALMNVDVTPAAADKVSVTGTATIGGTLNANLSAGPYAATQYALITSTGALTGTFSGFNITGATTNFTSALSYNANNVFLMLGNTISAGSTANVNSGTVAVTGNQTTGGLASSGSGGTVTLSSGSTLTDNQSTNTTFSGSITGSGAVVKTGGGSLILDGNSSSFTGTTAVNGGLLEVGDASTPGATLGGTVSVGSGGTLGGHGTLTGSVTNAGGTAPGGSIGTLTVNGNFAFASGATLQQEVAANGTADKLVVGGNVSITGNTALQVLATDPATSYARVTNYTIITAGNGVSGAFTTVTSSNAALMPVVSYGSNAVNLAVVRTDISLATLGTTPNQTGVGNAVSAAPTSALFAAVAPAADAAIPAGLDSLSGEVHATLADQLLYDGRFMEDAIHARGTSEGLHLWGSENYRTTGFGAGRGAAAASGHMLGFAIGGDLPVLENLRVGLALGNSRNTLDVSALASNGRVNATWLGGYADYQLGDLGVTASITHAWDNIATGRTVTLAASRETEAADYNAGTTTISDEIRYRVDLGSTIAEPFASVSAVRLETDAFKEAGGVAALSGISRDRNVLFTDLGARFSSSWDIGGSSLLPRLSLAWEHAADTVSATQTMTFGSGTSFNVSGAPLSRDALSMQAGAGLKLDGIDIDLGYEGRTGGNAHDDGVRLRLGVTW